MKVQRVIFDRATKCSFNFSLLLHKFLLACTLFELFWISIKDLVEFLFTDVIAGLAGTRRFLASISVSKETFPATCSLFQIALHPPWSPLQTHEIFVKSIQLHAAKISVSLILCTQCVWVTEWVTPKIYIFLSVKTALCYHGYDRLSSVK
jgi:hypothetical protein